MRLLFEGESESPREAYAQAYDSQQHGFEDVRVGHDFEALVEVANGSQWTIRARSLSDLRYEAQKILGSDLFGERYYVRHVLVDGRFNDAATQEFIALLRAY